MHFVTHFLNDEVTTDLIVVSSFGSQKFVHPGLHD